MRTTFGSQPLLEWAHPKGLLRGLRMPEGMLKGPWPEIGRRAKTGGVAASAFERMHRPSCLHRNARECMHTILCPQGSTQGCMQACGCVCGGAGVLACMQNGLPCPPLLMDAPSVASNARRGWPEAGEGRGCACMEPKREEEPCAHALRPPAPQLPWVEPRWNARRSCCGSVWNRVRSAGCDSFPCP